MFCIQVLFYILENLKLNKTLIEKYENKTQKLVYIFFNAYLFVIFLLVKTLFIVEERAVNIKLDEMDESIYFFKQIFIKS